jgi:hypothetical protein
MKNNVYDRMKRAREEHLHEMRETELISARFPDVSGIVVTMRYSNRFAPAMRRTLNFRPGSHAFFKVNCLGEGCVDGGLDMTGIVTSMVRNHEALAKGTLFCSNSDPAPVHADMTYRISITYN